MPPALLQDELSPLRAGGRWSVLTQTSAYVLDLAAGTCTRSSVSGEALRGDDGPVALHAVVRCRVGEPLVLVLDGLAERGPTLRTSTPVTELAEQRQA